MEWYEILISILSGLVALIPLVVQLVKYVKLAVEEKNWDKLLKLVIDLMAEAEGKFDDGLERKEWVLMMVKASADSINYPIDLEAISKMIDDLCDLTKVVNPPAEEIVVETETINVVKK